MAKPGSIPIAFIKRISPDVKKPPAKELIHHEVAINLTEAGSSRILCVMLCFVKFIKCKLN
jgi:hypothetical protein